MADCASCPHHSGVIAEQKAICAKLDLRFDASDRAIESAKQDMERRLESMNEFRAQLSSQANTFISRTELRLEMEKIITRILLLEKSMNFREGSRHWSDYIIMALVSGAIVLLAKMLHL